MWWKRTLWFLFRPQTSGNQWDQELSAVQKYSGAFEGCSVRMAGLEKMRILGIMEKIEPILLKRQFPGRFKKALEDDTDCLH